MDILTALQRVGITISLQGDNLAISPASNLTFELREAIKYQRDDIILALSLAENRGVNSDFRMSHVPRPM